MTLELTQMKSPFDGGCPFVQVGDLMINWGNT